MRIALKTLFLLLAVLLTGSITSAQESSVDYEAGSAIDLADLELASLYRGVDKQLVATNLDNRLIREHVHGVPDVWFLEYRITRSEHALSQQAIWLRLRSDVDAIEVKFNGQAITSSGTVGTSDAETVLGKHMFTGQIKPSLFAPGENILTIRFSNFTHPDRAIFRDISLSPLETIVTFEKVMTTAPLFYAGIFIFAVFINVGLFLAMGQQKVFLLLSGLYLLNFIVVAHEVLYWHAIADLLVRTEAVNLKTIFEFMIYAVLMLCLHYEFRLERKALVIAVLPSLIAAIFIPQIPSLVTWSVMPLLYSLQGCRGRKRYSVLTTVTLVLLVLLNILDGYNLVDELAMPGNSLLLKSFLYKLDNLGMIVVLVVMTMSTVQKILSNTAALTNARLRIHQLEYQFLQRQIQPHFIVNTLMALQQLITKDTATATKMIDALSEHFYLLSKSSNKIEVPIDQELDLCREFLAVMSYQQKTKFDLITTGIDGDEAIPPAIFHTVIENGVTHGFAGPQEGEFYVNKQNTSDGVRYTLGNNGSLSSTKPEAASAGTGTRYIEAKLDEWRPGKWRLISQSNDGRWITIIEIRD